MSSQKQQNIHFYSQGTRYLILLFISEYSFSKSQQINLIPCNSCIRLTKYIILFILYYEFNLNCFHRIGFKFDTISITERCARWRKSEGNIWKCNASHNFPKTTCTQFEPPSFYYKIFFHACYPRGSLHVKIEIFNKGQAKLHTCITCIRSYAPWEHSKIYIRKWSC